MHNGNYTAPDQKEVEEWLRSDRAPMREEAMRLMSGIPLRKRDEL